MAEKAVARIAVPEKIGRYDVVGHLATGGMAEVFLGKLVGHAGFERPVVIKRVLPHLARESMFRTMFLDEARTLAGLRNENIVQVHELGQENFELYLVMEYLEGESVAGVVRRAHARNRRIDYALVAHIIAEACAGLHAAHELVDDHGAPQGLVHRDVSPQNLFVTYDGSVKVIDFGIAKAPNRESRTTTGQIKGKFAYMAPEQCLSLPVDRRTDVFALGVVMYELLTGRRLFRRSNDLLVMRAICEEPVVPPSEVIKGCPAVLDEICLRALAHKPSGRFDTALEMQTALVAALPTLHLGGLPKQMLARVMQSLFADRIQEKRELLRQVRRGSVAIELPPVDVDVSVELPGVDPDDSATSGHVALLGEGQSRVTITSASRMLNQRRKRTRFGWALGVAVLVAFVVGLAGVVVMNQTATSAPDRQVAQSHPNPNTNQPEAVPPRSTTAPARVTLRMETTPPGARIWVGGTERGTTPLTMEVDRSDDPIALRFEADGFEALSEQLIPNANQRLRLELRRIEQPQTPRAARRPAARRPPSVEAPTGPAPTPTPNPEPPAPDYFRFQ